MTFRYGFSLESFEGACHLELQPVDARFCMKAMRTLRKEAQMRPESHIVKVRVFTALGDLWLDEQMTVEQFLNSDDEFFRINKMLLEAEDIIRLRGLLE